MVIVVGKSRSITEKQNFFLISALTLTTQLTIGQNLKGIRIDNRAGSCLIVRTKTSTTNIELKHDFESKSILVIISSFCKDALWWVARGISWNNALDCCDGFLKGKFVRRDDRISPTFLMRLVWSGANEMEIVSSSATINGRIRPIDAILASRLYWYTFRRQLSISPLLHAVRHRQQGNVSESLELFAKHRQMPKPSRSQHVRFGVISTKKAF